MDILMIILNSTKIVVASDEIEMIRLNSNSTIVSH